jgi:hypothetical protein
MGRRGEIYNINERRGRKQKNIFVLQYEYREM